MSKPSLDERILAYTKAEFYWGDEMLIDDLIADRARLKAALEDVAIDLAHYCTPGIHEKWRAEEALAKIKQIMEGK